MHKSAAANITPGFEVLVQDVIAAITTEPCFNSNYYPLNVNFEVSSKLFGSNPNPLNPTGLVNEVFQSFFSSFKAT